MKLILILTAAVALPGCLRSQVSETGAVHGVLNGQPVAVEWQHDSEGRTSVVLPPIMTAAAGFLPAPWGDIATGIMGLIAAGGLVAAKKNGARADEHKADAAEGWAKVDALHASKDDTA